MTIVSIISSLIALAAVLFSGIIHYRSNAQLEKEKKERAEEKNQINANVIDITKRVKNAVDENDSSSDVHVSDIMRKYDRARDNKD